MVDVVIDPGHGGRQPIGGSSPLGARGLGGSLEKDVTLEVARRLVERLRPRVRARLTRQGDTNLSLADRAAIAGREGARVFLSLHANSGRPGERGCETWVHERSGGASRALARRVQRALALVSGPDRGVKAADLAVLRADRVGRDAAACLVEIDFLSTDAGERRLRDARHLDAVAAAIAAAVREHLAESPAAAPDRNSRCPDRPAFRGPRARGLDLDLTDFDANQLSVRDPAVVPNNVTAAEMDTLKNAWGRMNAGTGLSLVGSDDDKKAFRTMLMDCMSTSRVLREAFLRITADDGHTVTLDLGRSQPQIFVDAFEFQQSTGTTGRGLHTIDLDDLDQLPRVSTTTHHNMQTKTHKLIHALTESAAGVRSAVVDANLRYLASHHSAIDEENRYRAEQGMQGTRGYDQPVQNGTDLEYHFTPGANGVFEVWHLSGSNISSIDYTN